MHGYRGKCYVICKINVYITSVYLSIHTHNFFKAIYPYTESKRENCVIFVYE